MLMDFKTSGATATAPSRNRVTFVSDHPTADLLNVKFFTPMKCLVVKIFPKSAPISTKYNLQQNVVIAQINYVSTLFRENDIN